MESLEGLFESVCLQAFGRVPAIRQYRLVAAGTRSQAIYLETDAGEYFLKTNHESSPEIFEREREGLDRLRAHCSLYVPQTLACGSHEDRHFLLMDWIGSGPEQADYSEQLGEGLAELHMCTSESFGLDRNNYIAVLAQKNKPKSRWYDFFVENRLEPQLQLAFYNQLIDSDFMARFRSLYEHLQDFFPSEKPALLHGDLWSGNVLPDATGAPALIDPAVYFGHREVDLAFSRLFGGFDDRFYEAYRSVFPLEQGFDERVAVYNLYPLLVHLNLFGKAYLSGIEHTLRRFLD
ncbi:fructosamine kinase family protein [Cyclobacterium xiamenense]|uniref:fructosamine kinase family protein n=1 Tax=Cyclobacterium xiamenense TaxID=1297121 RepID=UPI0035CFABD1